MFFFLLKYEKITSKSRIFRICRLSKKTISTKTKPFVRQYSWYYVIFEVSSIVGKQKNVFW